MPIDPQRH